MPESAAMPLRAAVVYDSLFPLTMGGGERVYRRLAESLVSRGAHTEYITRTFATDAAVDGFRVVGVWRGEIYDSRGVRTTSSAVAFAFAVFRYFLRRRGRHDLVLASALPVLTALAVRLALLGTSTRVVADWLEIWPAKKWRMYSGGFSGTLAFVLQSITARAIREHTVNSRFTAERLTAIRPSLHPVVLGLLDLVVPGTPRAAAEPPTVVFVGRLISDKGVLAVPPALAIARRELPELRAVIVGDGAERAALEAEITASGLAGAIDVLGRVSDEILDEVRAAAAVLVAPSVREGFGLAVAEASAWGVPAVVVAHEDNAAVDLIEPGVNGFIVGPHDGAALAKGIVDAVRAGRPLRTSTADWFAGARVKRGLSASLDEILNGRLRSAP